MIISSQQNLIEIGWLELSLSLTLLVVTFVLSFFFKLEIGKPVLFAGVRAAIQLIAVGLFFTAIFDHAYAITWAWIWVITMLGLATLVVKKRVPNISGLHFTTFLALGISISFVLAVIFPFSIIDYTPVNVVVMAGITLGNLLPIAVLAVQQLESQFSTRLLEAEALLALGADKKTQSVFLPPKLFKPH